MDEQSRKRKSDSFLDNVIDITSDSIDGDGFSMADEQQSISSSNNISNVSNINNNSSSSNNNGNTTSGSNSNSKNSYSRYKRTNNNVSNGNHSLLFVLFHS